MDEPFTNRNEYTEEENDRVLKELREFFTSTDHRIAIVRAPIAEDIPMDKLTEQVNAALDRVKIENSLNESQLADHIGIDRMALWRWRRGYYSKAFRTIIPLTVLVNTPLPPGWSEQANDIRVLAPLLKLPNIGS